MKSKLFLGLSEYRRFWRLRVNTHRITFTILARFFQLRYFASEEKANSRILASFFRVAFSQLLFAAIVAFSLELFELFLLPPFFWRWDSPNSSDYVTWLGIFSQIGGVFIALYFTAVTAAAGAIYAQVPNNIRDLLARERVGNIYIRYLTFATFVPLCLVALRLVGFEPLRLAVPFIVIVGGIGIVCFTTLGRRAFDLFDPTRLSSALFADFGSWLRQVSAGGFRWQDSAFQNHAHRQANAVVDTLNTLADLAATHANLDSSPLLEFSVRILALLEEYKRRKLLIPSVSLWFEQKYQHSEWFLSPDSATGMAYNTGGALNPKAVSQPNWLEDRLQSIPIKCLKLNLQRHRYDNIRDLLSGIYSYVDTTTNTGSIRDALLLTEHLRSSVHEICGVPRSQSGAPTEDVEAIGIADAFSVLPIRILLAFRSVLDESSPATLPKRLVQIRWTQRESIYRAAFRSEEVKQLEWLQPRIRIEIDIHGKAITPVWYQQDLVAKSLAEGAVEGAKLLVEDACTFFQHWSEELIESDRVWQAAAVLSRYHEYLTKLETHHFRFFKSYFDDLVTSRHLSDLPWPEMDTQVLAEHLQANLVQFRLMIASHIALLLRSQKPLGAPDYLGQFIHATAENMFNALIETKPQDVRLLLRPYLFGCFSLFEKMKPVKVTAGVWFEQQIQVAVAPILDLLELSGYAKLLSELSGDQNLWLAVTEVWDQLMGATPEMLSWLAAIVQAGTPRFQIPHRGLVRTRWSMRIRRELERLPRKRAFSGGIGGIFGSESIDHQSALVRYCAKYQHYNGKDIFAYTYLAMRPGGDGLEWGRPVREFADSVNREERTYEEGENETQA